MDSLDELTQRMRLFVAERDWQRHQSPKNLVMALTAEVGELVEHFQWLGEPEIREIGGEIGGEKKQAVAMEMADVLIYLTRMADELGIDLVAAAHEKCERNELKYPKEAYRGVYRRPDQG